jgi:hypothetical protein
MKNLCLTLLENEGPTKVLAEGFEWALEIVGVTNLRIIPSHSGLQL